MKQENIQNVRCPSCNSIAIDAVGAIPPSVHFSGQRLSMPIPGGELHRCRSCHLSFRWPRLTKDELDGLYCQTPVGNWQYSPSSRTDWRIAEKWIHRYNERGRILDIGCYDGGFLSFMGEKYKHYGIEINQEAARRARARNIEIVGADFDDIAKLSAEFDIVVAMDVIEHAENPAALLDSMSRAVRSGGLLMVSTGNTESWPWRMMGSRYWYCTVSEHISFINPNWCRYVAPAANLEIVGVEYFAHYGCATLSQRIADLGKNLIYHLFPGTVARLRTGGYGGVDTSAHKSMAYTPPMWFSATDHFIVVFRKS